MRLSLKQIEGMTLEQVKKELSKNEAYKTELLQLENKSVAFYNRDFHDTEINIYNLNYQLNVLLKK